MTGLRPRLGRCRRAAPARRDPLGEPPRPRPQDPLHASRTPTATPRSGAPCAAPSSAARSPSRSARRPRTGRRHRRGARAPVLRGAASASGRSWDRASRSSLSTVGAFMETATGGTLAGEALWEVLRPAVESALGELQATRAREGEALAVDLRARRERLVELAASLRRGRGQAAAQVRRAPRRSAGGPVPRRGGGARPAGAGGGADGRAAGRQRGAGPPGHPPRASGDAAGRRAGGPRAFRAPANGASGASSTSCSRRSAAS